MSTAKSNILIYCALAAAIVVDLLAFAWLLTRVGPPSAIDLILVTIVISVLLVALFFIDRRLGSG
jgi:hypothetical protein